MDSLIRSSKIAAMFATLVLTFVSTGCVAQSSVKNQGSTTKGPAAGSTSKPADGAQTTATTHPALTNPSLATKQAPEKFRAKFSTTKGDFVIEVTREWSPLGADRFYNLIDIGYLKDIVIFRAVPGFMLQFGVHGDPGISQHWKDANINDDPVGKASNLPGYISFAKTGLPNSRSAQMFINVANNSGLDRQGFTPFGKVVEGLEIVGKLNTEYGENDREDQGAFVANGNDWILKKYPRLDIIKSVDLVEMQ